ncbi:DUF1232 domain-containing protein [soil metagenome]
MTGWQWLGVSLLTALTIYLAFVIGLIAAGRTGAARALISLIPDCLVLFRRLLKDPRVPRRRKLALLAVIPYLAVPIDVVPDFIPIAGYLDDAIIVALVLRYVLRGATTELIQEHWTGPSESLALILRLAGHAPTTPPPRGPSSTG